MIEESKKYKTFQISLKENIKLNIFYHKHSHYIEIKSYNHKDYKSFIINNQQLSKIYFDVNDIDSSFENLFSKSELKLKSVLDKEIYIEVYKNVQLDSVFNEEEVKLPGDPKQIIFFYCLHIINNYLKSEECVCECKCKYYYIKSYIIY